jgi:xylulokinase
MAAKAPRGSGGLLLLPMFAGKLSPDCNEGARGVFFGIELGHTKGHFVRAIMEGVACMLRENLEAIYPLCDEADRIVSTGGGAKSALWNQIKADVVNRQICVPREEGASLGAAIIGAVSAGWFRSVEEACAASVRISENYAPGAEGVLEYQRLYEKYLLVYRSLLPVFHKN